MDRLVLLSRQVSFRAKYFIRPEHSVLNSFKTSFSDYIFAVGGDKKTMWEDELHNKTELFSHTSNTWSPEQDYPFGAEYSIV